MQPPSDDTPPDIVEIPVPDQPGLGDGDTLLVEIRDVTYRRC